MRQKKKTEEPVQQGELFAGDALRSKRQEMKLSVDQIAKKLCIRAKYLTALEEKNYKVFPAMTYTYGFLRTYAEFLGLDADELVQKVKQETSGLSRKEERPVYSLPEKQNLFPSFSALSAAVLLMALAYLLWHVFLTPYVYEEAEQVPSSSSLEEVLPSDSTEEAEEKGLLNENRISAGDAATLLEQTDEKVPSVSSVSENIPDEEEPNVPARAIQPPVVPELDASEVAAVKNQDRSDMSDDRTRDLKKESDLLDNFRKTEYKVYGSTEDEARVWLIANDETWVEIIDVDTVVLSRVLKKGDRYYAPESDDLLMKTGNAGGLDIYIDGVLYPALGKKGAVYSGVSLSPDELKERLNKNKVD